MHDQYMEMAIREAKKGIGNTYTNPLVGAVLVCEDEVIATGAHFAYGEKHAEQVALDQCSAPELISNSTLYVTLEPCHHQGKQPACTQAIVTSGISRVVIGQLDPNPLVAGKGKAFLESQGIEVITGIKEIEVRELNPAYLTFYEQNRPYVTLKQAITLDGKIAYDRNQQTTITSKSAYDMVHDERANYQAIVVGSQTALTDDPQLLATTVSNFPPVRVVLDRRGRIFEQMDLQLFQPSEVPVLILTEQVFIPDMPDHVTVHSLETLTIQQVLAYLVTQKIQSLYVEGGAQIHDAFLKSELYDEVITYLSPKILGGTSVPSFSSDQLPRCSYLSITQVLTVGEDLKITARRLSTCSPD
ncbi:bifunctional diaminohydroxyphosphoribosylaminopyrimidine deaminase/5-amino-6-(5-phosphoribosylamino)uracil reductase RibD [uncultured Enterococcus sp.]|uniref:bifunctional diaminohydroxyphosphoribosylaminopyrimidine deaminase/5-amino-6-(5-phosphoribosylamino)uracil reductase RibD n=1 Tax=uncultured Enterococcus sp. TaxID=167972 RepID=UPI0025F1AB6C|nr:bifunctional diaminohydroxyphosphoribosylaminopyrimidine deaminase/5-amino-6-(5-phosphoribosylamino)uracil reductase RibD [uncultured Enterococcus sp.]